MFFSCISSVPVEYLPIDYSQSVIVVIFLFSSNAYVCFFSQHAYNSDAQDFHRRISERMCLIPPQSALRITLYLLGIFNSHVVNPIEFVQGKQLFKSS